MLRDAANGFSAAVTEQVAVGGSARTTVVLVNMVNAQTVGDDRISPGVGCRSLLDRQDCVDMTYEQYHELLEDDSDSSEDFDLYDPRDYETEWERSSAEEAGMIGWLRSRSPWEGH